MKDPFDPQHWNAVEIAESRTNYSLAAQVVYQCRLLALLRELPDLAAELLRDPIALQKEYKARYPEEFRVEEIDDY